MIEPIQWKASLSVLTERELDKIHRASLTILERTGLAMPLAQDRYDVLEAAGCRIDRDHHRVRFPAEVVETALKQAPAHYTLGARNPRHSLDLDGRHGYLTLDGTGLKILDLQSGQVRPSTYADLCDAVRVAEALPQIAFLWPCVSARDKSPPVQPLYELYAMFHHSTKHIQAMTAVTPMTARGSVEMAAALVGGRAALKQNPIISNFQCSISPLSYDENALEAALIFAEAGIPVGFLNMQIGCATAPATLAGNIAMGNAEILAGIAFLQIFHPGAKTFYGSCATMMELHTGLVTAGGPDDLLLQAAAAQLAQYYGIPSNVGTFATGAKASDWHAGVENTASGAVSQFCRTDMMCGAGLTNGATVFSFEQLLMDCEIYDIIKQVSQGIQVDDDTLAVDVIDQVGPRHHFMTSPHTLKTIRRIWQPSIIDRTPYDQWQERGRPTAVDHARNKALNLLQSLEPNEFRESPILLEIVKEYESK